MTFIIRVYKDDEQINVVVVADNSDSAKQLVADYHDIRTVNIVFCSVLGFNEVYTIDN